MVTVEGFPDSEGYAMLALFGSEQAYAEGSPETAKAKVNVEDKKALATFIDLPYGTYAVAVYHDRNANGKMDKNFLGIPKESYGHSNNAGGSFGPPPFDKAKFEFGSPEKQITNLSSINCGVNDGTTMPDNQKSLLKRLKIAIFLFVVFWIIAILFFLITGNVFFLFNFGYIGTAVATGIGAYELLPRKRKPAGRRFAQLLVGIYMLGFLGLIEFENMQIEGFFFYILGGFFASSVIHYLVAKVFGPIIFGRGWCGWACWTAMVLDYLPYKRNKSGRLAPGWEKIRYLHFGLSLSLVVMLWYYFGYRPELYGLNRIAVANHW